MKKVAIVQKIESNKPYFIFELRHNAVEQIVELKELISKFKYVNSSNEEDSILMQTLIENGEVQIGNDLLYVRQLSPVF